MTEMCFFIFHFFKKRAKIASKICSGHNFNFLTPPPPPKDSRVFFSISENRRGENQTHVHSHLMYMALIVPLGNSKPFPFLCVTSKCCSTTESVIWIPSKSAQILAVFFAPFFHWLNHTTRQWTILIPQAFSSSCALFYFKECYPPHFPL